MKLTQEQTKKILEVLREKDFLILSFGRSFEVPFWEISADYFNEILNEVLEK